VCCMPISAASGRVVKEGRKSFSVAQKLDVTNRVDKGEQSMDNLCCLCH
jgi:hypothetical protein